MSKSAPNVVGLRRVLEQEEESRRSEKIALPALSRSPVEDAGAEGDSRKQREEEQKQKQQEYFVVRGLTARHDELVERTSVPRVFSRSS
jgi:hypothetical protein